MSEGYRVEIQPRGSLSEQCLDDLTELANDLIEAGLSVEPATVTVPGRKDGGLTIGISLASLALSGISTLVGALAYWKSTRPKYSVTIKQGDTTFQVTNLDQAEILDVTEKLTKGSAAQPVFVDVSDSN